MGRVKPVLLARAAVVIVDTLTSIAFLEESLTRGVLVRISIGFDVWSMQNDGVIDSLAKLNSVGFDSLTRGWFPVDVVMNLESVINKTYL